MSTFTIAPIPGREVLQKNFVSLPSKADNYAGRRISLNERFSIIERGYYLKPDETGKNERKVRIVNDKKTPNEKDCTKMLKAEMEKKRAREQKQAQKNSSSAATSPTHSTATTATTVDDSPSLSSDFSMPSSPATDNEEVE